MNDFGRPWCKHCYGYVTCHPDCPVVTGRWPDDDGDDDE